MQIRTMFINMYKGCNKKEHRNTSARADDVCAFINYIVKIVIESVGSKFK